MDSVSDGVRRRTALQVSVGFSIVALGIFGYGTWRLSDSPTAHSAVRIAVVSDNTDDDSAWTTPGGPAILANYARAINDAARQGAKIVLLPEKIIDIQASALPGLSDSFQKLATSNNIQLVVGLTVFGDQGNDYNRALVFSPGGGAPTALLRGIENGIPMARDGSKGRLTPTDQHGRTVSEAPALSNRSVTLIGDLTPGIARTPYTRWGDWFAYLCILLTTAGALNLVRLGSSSSRR